MKKVNHLSLFMLLVCVIMSNNLFSKEVKFNWEEIKLDNYQFKDVVEKIDDTYYYGVKSGDKTIIVRSDELCKNFEYLETIDGSITDFSKIGDKIYIVSFKQVGFTYNAFIYTLINNELIKEFEIENFLPSDMQVFKDQLYILGIKIQNGQALFGRVFQIDHTADTYNEIEFNYHPIMNAQVSDDELYILTLSGNTYKTEDMNNWTEILSLNDKSTTYRMLRILNDKTFICNFKSEILTENIDGLWENCFTGNSNIKFWDIINVADDAYLAVGEKNGIGIAYLTTDNANSWTLVQEFDYPINKIFLDNDKVLLLTRNEVIYLSDIILGVFQNEQNDFKIKYENNILSFSNLELDQKAKIIVYDYSGKLIFNELTWNNYINIVLNNGMYIIKIIEGNKAFSSKIMISK